MKTISTGIISFLIIWCFLTSFFKINNPSFTYGGDKFRNKVITPIFFVIPGILLLIVLVGEINY